MRPDREPGERRLRIGVLGAGQIAQAAHFDAVRKSRNADLFAICDVAEDLLERVAAIHAPAKTYAAYDLMLADPDVDAVIVAIADQFHAEAAARAITAGKHVLVEKPLGVTVEECEALARQVPQSSLVLQVGSMKRFDPGIAFARRFISDEMGGMIALKAWYCDSAYRYAMTGTLQPIIVRSAGSLRPPGDPKADLRRYLLLAHGSHLLDTARFLGGEMVSVRARHVGKTGIRSWFVDVEFASGANGHLDLTVPVRMDWHEGFHVYGEGGSVIGKTFNPWYFRASEVECFSARDRQYHRPLGEDAHVYRLQVEAFAERILTGANHHGATVDDGLAALRGLVAIARSSETGERVRLDEVTGGP